MFGLSLSKIALTAAVIFAVWYGFKYLNRITGPAKSGSKSGSSPTLENLQQCVVCGIYAVAIPAPACDRDDCPHL